MECLFLTPESTSVLEARGSVLFVFLYSLIDPFRGTLSEESIELLPIQAQTKGIKSVEGIRHCDTWDPTASCFS